MGCEKGVAFSQPPFKHSTKHPEIYLPIDARTYYVYNILIKEENDGKSI